MLTQSPSGVPVTHVWKWSIAAEAADAEIDSAEMEVFYTFTWARPARRQNNERSRGKGKPAPRGKKPAREGGKGGKTDKAQNFSARPPRKEKPIDPDNPFAAALMGLKDGK